MAASCLVDDRGLSVINGIAYSSDTDTISGIAYPLEEDMTPDRPGRPAIGPMVNVRLPEELIAKLDEHAAYYGISRAEVIRLLLTIEIEEGGSYSTRILDRILGKND